MSSADDFESITTNAKVETYKATTSIFDGLLKELRELSRKKPEATMSGSKVKMINLVLNDLLMVLTDEPEGKFCMALDDAALPQMSDAVLTMVQFESALKSFRVRYHKRVSDAYYWITQELMREWGDDEEPDQDS